MNHVMSDVHDDLLHQMTGTPIGQDLPEEVVETYWQFKRPMDRAGSPITIEGLALIIYLSGQTQRKVADMHLEFAPELFQKGKLKAGDPIEVTWRKKPTPAVFIGINGAGEVRCEINGAERVVPAVDVIVADMATC